MTDEDVARWRKGGHLARIAELVEGHFGCRALATKPNDDCRYLSRDGRTATCTIYDHRPETCAAFRAFCPQCIEYRRRGQRN